MEAPTQAVSQWVRLRRARDIDLADPAQRRFGDFELIERLGAGGMGVVYRVRQLSLEREVALKLVGVDSASGEAWISAFRSEARHAGRLQHPNIVPVYEIGSVDHLYYLSMGLVSGPTLQAWAQAQPQADPREIARLLRRIAEAIEYAHGVGVLHLDLKPGNVLLDARGEPQVSDFGLAQRLGTEARSQAVGTPGYMAPEQAEDGLALSPATDVWGLGAVLYRLLCGRAPVLVEHGQVASWRVADPRDLCSGLPADLVAICLRCLRVEAAQRYQSARELADDLQRYLDGRPVSVRRQGAAERLRGWARREPRTAALALGLLLTLLLGLAASTQLWLRAEANRMQAQSTLWQARRASLLDAAARGDPLQALPALVDNIAEAEAAGRVDEAHIDRLRLSLLMQQSPRAIAVWPQGDEGRALAFAQQGALLLAGLRGGELRALRVKDGSLLWSQRPPFPPTPWGPSYVGRIQPTVDGLHALLYPSGSSGVVRPDTSAMQRVDLRSGALLPAPAAFVGFEAASYSVDGGRALLRADDGAVQLWQVDPWQPMGTRFDGAGARHCLPLPASTHVACARGGFTEVELLDATDGRSVQRVRFDDGAELLSWGSDAAGRWLALGSSAGALRLLDLQTLQQTEFGEAGEGGVVDLGFAGARLAVVYAKGSVRLLNLARGAWASPRLRAGGGSLDAARIDSEGRWLLGNDGRIAVWSLADSEGLLQPRAQTLLRHAGAVIGFQAFALQPEQGLVASQGSGGELTLWRLPFAEEGIGPGPLQPGDASAAAATDDAAVAALAALARQQPGAIAYRLEFAARGRRAVLAEGASLWIADDAALPRLRELSLPSSAQYLLTAPAAERALVGWIESEGALRLRWRLLDTARAEWLGVGFSTEGQPAGLRLSDAGERVLLWQGRLLQDIDTVGDGTVRALQLDGEPVLRINDATFDANGELVLATQARSVVQGATIERWQLQSGRWRRIDRIDTPYGHVRVLPGPHGVVGHGPRPALYANGRGIELGSFGAEFSEHAALSPEGRIVALGGRGRLLLVDLLARQAVLPPLALPLDADDALANLAFDAEGDALELRSHYGRRQRIDLRADERPLYPLHLEAADFAPDPTSPLMGGRAEDPELRRARDPGPPVRDGDADRSAAAPLGWTNVSAGRRFQGSRGGLGITDSAAWPRGRMRLRGIDYVLGDALQLAPEGEALGAAQFPSVSPVLPVPRSGQLFHLLLTQQGAHAAEIEVEWVATDESLVARTRVTVPAAADPSGAGGLDAPVALLVRTAESRQRGGGSPVLRVFAVAIKPPERAAPVAGLRLRALDSAPLLLGLEAPEPP
ncbi:MAG: protein kinase domain-containing protein [Lysobacterales bacterium]